MELKTVWFRQEGSNILSVVVHPASRLSGVKSVLVSSDCVNPHGGGGGTGCSGKEFLKGKLWKEIRDDHGESVLREVIATVKAFSLKRSCRKREEIEHWLQKQYESFLRAPKAVDKNAWRRACKPSSNERLLERLNKAQAREEETRASRWSQQPARGPKVPRKPYTQKGNCKVCSKLRSCDSKADPSATFRRVHREPHPQGDTYFLKCPECGNYYRYAWESEDFDNSPKNVVGYRWSALSLPQALRELPHQCRFE